MLFGVQTNAYDGAGRLLTATQNAQSAQAQTRSFTYDDLGRMTSEANPETGTIHYVYDSDATCGTSNGDLVKKTDGAGNVICHAYDALHRTTSITYPSGPNSSNTPSKHFVYDSATVNSVAMANAKTRLAETYTCVRAYRALWKRPAFWLLLIAFLPAYVSLWWFFILKLTEAASLLQESAVYAVAGGAEVFVFALIVFWLYHRGPDTSSLY